MVLVLGKIDDVDEVFVNGRLIGSTGRITDYGARISGHEWQEFRGYYIPRGLVEADGEMTIAVRVYDGRGAGGIHEGPVGIMDSDEYEEFWKENYRNNRSFWSYFDSW